MNNFLSKETAKFFNPSEDELQREQEKYGNLFMNLRKKQIKKAVDFSQTIDKKIDQFNKRMGTRQQTSYNKYGHLMDKYTSGTEQPNSNEIHSRYGHLLDKYIK